MQDYKFVGFWQRVVMYILDLMIISGIIFLISQIFKVKFTSKEDIGFIVSFLVNLSLIIPAIYTILFWKFKGATPGKIIRRVKIVDPKTGDIPKLWRLIVRYLCYPISKSLLFFGFFWIGLDSRKQSWHDKIARTIVIKQNIIKIPKNAGYDYKIPESESLFPTYPSNSDIRKWRIGKILMILSIISLFAISWILGDEPLFTEAENWLYEPAFIENNPKDNGFYYLLGVFSSEEENCFDIGYEWVQNQKEYILDYAKGIKTKQDSSEWIDQLEIKIDFPEMQDIFYSDLFLQYCIENKEYIMNTYNQYSYLNDRMANIPNHKYFKNTLIPHYATRSPIFMDLVKFNLLQNFYITTLYANGNHNEALKLLKQDISNIRLLAEKADFIILKLVTSILLEKDFMTYNHLLDLKINENKKLKKGINYIKLNTPFVRDMEKSTKRSFIEQINTIISTLNQYQNIYKHKMHFLKKKEVRNSRSIIFKPNKTINQLFLIKYSFVRLSKVSAKEFIELDKYPYVFNPYTEDAFKWDTGKSTIYFIGPYQEDIKLREIKINL